LRNFSALTQGDINQIIFGLLVMETSPAGEGISVLDTDLEVDFAAPVGYVEPECPKVLPPTTMASKLNIDLNSQLPGTSQEEDSQAIAPVSWQSARMEINWKASRNQGQRRDTRGEENKGKAISLRKSSSGVFIILLILRY
jgi:ubiquitin fusion degradation protein 1